MLDRINFMLSIAEEHGVQTLILGAFEWNPETYGGKRKIFAVPGLFEF